MINKETLCRNQQMIRMVLDSLLRPECRPVLGAAIINLGENRRRHECVRKPSLKIG